MSDGSGGLVEKVALGVSTRRLYAAMAAAAVQVVQDQLPKLEKRIEYGHDVGGAIGWVPEHRGIKYARHRRTVHFYVDEPLLVNHWTKDGLREPFDPQPGGWG